MCGRTCCNLTDVDIVAAVQGRPAGDEKKEGTSPTPTITWPRRSLYTPLHNAGPTRVTPVVTRVAADGTAITVESMVWGVPRGGGPTSPSSPPSSSAVLVNARAESAFSTPTWARLLASGVTGRAVVLANGYFEWKRPPSGGTSVPHFVFRSDRTPLALAALASPAPPGSPDPPLRRYAVLTTSPPQALAWLHDRVPLLLPTAGAVQAWLSEKDTISPSTLAALACPAAVESWPALNAHPVKLEVGNVRYQAADCTSDVRARPGSLGRLFAKMAAKKAEEASPSPPAKRVKVETGGQVGVAAPKQQKRKGGTLDAWVKE